MALITCPECGKKISDKADACIHCGYPLHNKQKTEGEYHCLLETMRKEQEEMEESLDNIMNGGKKIDLMSTTLPIGWYF